MRTIVALLLLWLGASSAMAGDLAQQITTATSGTTITIPPGDHDLGQGFWVKGISRLTIQGDPNNLPTIRCSREMGFAGCDRLTIRDVRIVSGALNGLHIRPLVDDPKGWRGVGHVTIERVTIDGLALAGNADGIKLVWTDETTIRDVRIDSWGQDGSAVDCVGGRRITFERITAVGPKPPNASAGIGDPLRYGGQNGLMVKGGCDRVTIRDCRLFGAGKHALQIGGSTGQAWIRPGLSADVTRVDLTGNLVVGSFAAVALPGAADVTITRNTFVDPEYTLPIRASDQKPAAMRLSVDASNVVVRAGVVSVVEKY